VLGRFGERPTAALVDEIESGNVRALIVAGGNPLRAVPGSERLAAAIERLEVLAVADVIEGATVAAASHVLACSAQFERADVGLVESMYPVPASQYTPALVEPAGESRQAFELWSALASRLGLPTVATSSEALFDVLSGHRALELRSARILLGEPEYGWFTDHILPGGRWSLAPEPLALRLALALAATPPDPEQLQLVPRRQQGRMNSVAFAAHDRPDLLVSPGDAEHLGLSDGAAARVTSGGGGLDAVVRVTPGIRRGAVSLPHGYDAPNISMLTIDTATVHPDYAMPVLSAVPVAVTRRTDR
jgi:anaerobic selenocysteine-containing dehydrogenase